ncbi:response regulator [Candidatus Neomarinimicrobiota bacterium]
MIDQPVVLIIDDEESMRNSCTQILTKEGFKAFTAVEGTQGLEKIKAHKPDLALVDLMMPGINGLDLLDKISEEDPGIISIVITGYPTIDTAVEAMKRGAYDFLPKPFSSEELRIIVRRGYERRSLLQESNRLREEKQRLQEYFVTLVSHEIRSPLATVQQNFLTLLGGYVEDMKSEQKEVIRMCSERIDGVVALVEDWLSKERVEKGQGVGAYKPLNMIRLLEKVCSEYFPVAENDHVEFNLELPFDCPVIIGNESSVEVLFSNLVSNGIKYNRAGGALDINLSWNADQLKIVLADTGIGIPEDKLPLIFEEFYRVPVVGNRKKPSGSGLGLAIVKRIVDAHHGTVQVQSEPGKGSTFTVALPIFLG